MIEKRLPGGKVKKKAKNEVVLETSTRSKKKCVTTILGEGRAHVQLPALGLLSPMQLCIMPQTQQLLIS